MSEVLRAYIALPGSLASEVAAAGLAGLASVAEDRLLEFVVSRVAAVGGARVLARSDPDGAGCVVSIVLGREQAEVWRGGDESDGAPLETLWVDRRSIAEFDETLIERPTVEGFYS